MITVKLMHPDAGHEADKDKENIKKLRPNKYYEVSNIDMGQSHTYVYLANIEGAFNSVNFEFYEDKKLIDIFSDKRFNPYLD